MTNKTLQTNRAYVLPGTYIGEDIQPSPPELYLDDAGISRVRVTRNGKLFEAH